MYFGFWASNVDKLFLVKNNVNLKSNSPDIYLKFATLRCYAGLGYQV